MSLEGLDGGGAVREPSDRREALHGEMKSVTVFIAGSVEGTTGSRHKRVCTNTHTRTPTHTQRHNMTDNTDTLTHT